MAFAFFRRRQKTVIIVMVALMVSFLVGMQGLSMILSPDRGKAAVGTWSGGEIAYNDIRRAASDLSILAGYLRLGNYYRMLQTLELTDAEFLQLNANKNNRELAYAILQAQADARGVVVTDADVQMFLAKMGLSVESEGYKNLTLSLKEQHSMPTEQFHAVVARWLAVNKAFSAANVSAPPSTPRLEKLFRDLNELIELRVVKIPAGKFIEKIAKPSDEEIEKLFNERKGFFSGAYRDENDFGFGYRQPDLVKIQYMFINKFAIARAIRPDEAEVRRYYRKNRAALTKKVKKAGEKSPVRSDKKEGEESPESDAQAEFDVVQMDLIEAMDQIVKLLSDVQAQRATDSLLARIQTLVAEFTDKDGQVQPGVYRKVMASLLLTEPARSVLAATIAEVTIKNESLNAAMDILATAAGVKAICHPYIGGKYADKKISLRAKNITLGEALKRISKKLGAKPSKWVMCYGLDGVLFVLGDREKTVGTFPIWIADSPLLSNRQLLSHPILGKSVTSPSGGKTLASIAAGAEGLTREAGSPVLIRLGGIGPQMYVCPKEDQVVGRLIWQLTGAESQREPEKLTDALKLQVIRDWKIRIAFLNQAAKTASKIADKARKATLESAAKSARVESAKAGPFARRRVAWGMPIRFVPSDVPTMELPPMPLNARSDACLRVLEKIFSLIPHRIEPPYPDKPVAVAVVPVAALRAVFVIQRTDYRPPVRSLFENPWKARLAKALMDIQRHDARQNWFEYQSIVDRTGFKPDKGS